MINNEHIQNEAILQQHQHQDNKQVSSLFSLNSQIALGGGSRKRKYFFTIFAYIDKLEIKCEIYRLDKDRITKVKI